MFRRTPLSSADPLMVPSTSGVRSQYRRVVVIFFYLAYDENMTILMQLIGKCLTRQQQFVVMIFLTSFRGNLKKDEGKEERSYLSTGRRKISDESYVFVDS